MDGFRFTFFFFLRDIENDLHPSKKKNTPVEYFLWKDKTCFLVCNFDIFFHLPLLLSRTISYFLSGSFTV